VAFLLFTTIFTLHPRNVTAQTLHDGDTLTIEDCEDNHGAHGGCGTWVFNGSHGHGSWPDGTSANLELETFTESEIKVHRTDSEGLQKGIDAVYTGHRTGNQIKGTVSWIWPNHVWPWHKGTIKFDATIQSLVYAPTGKLTGASMPAAGIQAGQQTGGSICYRFTGSATKTGSTQATPVAIDLTLERIPSPLIDPPQHLQRYLFDESGVTASAGSVKGTAIVHFGDITARFTNFQINLPLRGSTGPTGSGTFLSVHGSHFLTDAADMMSIRTFNFSLSSDRNLFPNGLVPDFPSADQWVSCSEGKKGLICTPQQGGLTIDMPDDYVTGGSISYAGSCAECKPPVAYDVSLDLHSQEQSNWCWAAVTEMLMANVPAGKDVKQCEQAERQWSGLNCCPGEKKDMPPACNQELGLNGALRNYGYRCTQGGAWFLTMSAADMRQELACKNRIIAFTWRNDEGNQHVMIIYGYETDGNGFKLHIYNPGVTGSTMKNGTPGMICMHSDKCTISYDDFKSPTPFSFAGTCSDIHH
jgi:hypothetical protein